MADTDLEARASWVFVVSDDPRVRDVAGFGFGSSVEVTFAADAREALEVMREGIPAAVVVDMHAGSAGGFALVKDMKADPRLSRVPVLMLLQRDQDAWLAREAGAELHRTKPIDASELVEAALSLTDAAA